MAEDKGETVAEEQPANAAATTATTAAATDDKKDSVQENGTEDQPEPVKEMRAIVLTGFGGLKSVKVLKRPEPTLAEGELLVRVKACGLNFQDLMVRQGAVDSPPKCPFILGSECAGVVEQIGEGVDGFKVGDNVVALCESKAWSELVTAPSKHVFKLPPGMSFLDAAATAMNYAVAYLLLFEVAGLTSGKSVLVHSAGGGVGLAVAQLAKTVPDVIVFGVCSKGKHEALKAANVPIDHLLERSGDYPSEVRKVSPEGVDIVLDCLCGEECNRGYSLLKPMGKYVLYGSSNAITGETKSFFSAAKSWWQVDKVSPLKLFDESRGVCGFNLRRLLFHQSRTDVVQRALDKVFALWKDGKVKPVVDSTWAIEDVHEAMQKMHDRKNIGKILLDPAMEPKPKPVTPAKEKGKKKQSSEDKKDSEEKKEEDKKEGKKEDNSPTTNGTSENEGESKEKEASS